jgi:D-arabinose 1-dehydrogenase-like Zn-dependent alcohol dehydrogenase
MSEKLQNYRAGQGTLPTTQKAWHLYGQGLENLGRDRAPVEIPVPQAGPRELLARIDTCGLCFSDIKVINQGGSHPRLYNRDLANDPVVLGHEVAMTLVDVGAEMAAEFKVGDRFVIQADIYYKGLSQAFGYMLPGGLQQYVRLGDEVLRGDDGCYLIPIKDQTGYSEAALAEPWACVVRAYRDTRRQAMKAGGKCWVLGCLSCQALNYEMGGVDTLSAPAEIIISNCPENVVHAVQNVTDVPGSKVVQADGENLAEIAQRYAPEGFDEIFVLGSCAEVVEEAAAHLGKEGIMTIISRQGFERLVQVDVGRVHYDNLQFVSAPQETPLAGYKAPRPLKLQAGGKCWISGAGGPMGQMHVQLACEASDGPQVIVCTDIDTDRLNRIPERFGEAASRRGATLVVLNPRESGNEEFEKQLQAIAPAGFDDVVCLVPVPAIVSQCSRFLGQRGVFNIFAGVGRGTMADLDLSSVVQKQVRYFGSSGSGIEDLEQTLQLAEQGELSPDMAVAAIGGLSAAWDGLQGVLESSYPGKIVIYPQIETLALTSLDDLAATLPDVAAHLGPNNTWTAAAEAALLEHFIS